MGAKLFHADEGQTDRHDGDISRFSQFYERAYKSLLPLSTRIYRVIHKSLRNFRTRLRNNQDRHGRKEHINR